MTFSSLRTFPALMGELAHMLKNAAATTAAFNPTQSHGVAPRPGAAAHSQYRKNTYLAAN
jgi:hypothetical protein